MATQKDTKIPQQERSIQKKQQIIAAGFELFCKQGYYHTNTAEIAKAAGVSTGIVYRYFPDKKAIYIAAISNFMDSSIENIHQRLLELTDIQDFELFLSNLIHEIIEMHFDGKEIHQEINAMMHEDEEIGTIYYTWEENMTRAVMDAFSKTPFHGENRFEKVHLIIHMVEDYCHEIVFHKHKDMNYDVMKQMLIKSIIFLLEMP